MQQYFTEKLIHINDKVSLDEDTLYHLKKVLRKTDGYTFRLCSDKKIFICALEGNNASVLEELEEDNELKCDITVIMSLIKADKWDMTLQKLTELGVKRIVPYEARRSVVKKGKDNKIERFKKILREASEQSHRNIIPEITDYLNLKDLDKYKSTLNYFAYEKQDSSINDIKTADSITYVIGPEGGFEPEEVEFFKEHGFEVISLGKRILRAETAAIYLASVLGSKAE